MEHATKRITVKDIAKQLHIAQGTVSKALGNQAGVSAELRATILQTAKEMGYTANHLARAMSRSLIRVGIIMPEIWPNYYGTIMSGIKEQLKFYSDYRFEAVYHYLPTLLAEEALKQCIEECIKEDVDAIILSASFNSSCADCLNKLDDYGIKLILVGTDILNVNRVTCVQIDAKKAGALAGEFANLVMHRSRRIAALIGSRQMLEHEEKLHSFAAVIKNSGSEIVGLYETQDIPEIAAILTRKLVQENPDLEMIYVGTSNSVAVCEQLNSLDPECRIRVIATDVFQELLPHVESGRVIAAINQDLKRMGALTLEQSYYLLFQHKAITENIKIEPALVLRTNMLGNPDLNG